jgi:hypothetical protein
MPARHSRSIYDLVIPADRLVETRQAIATTLLDGRETPVIIVTVIAEKGIGTLPRARHPDEAREG